MERIINNIQAYIFAILGIAALVGVLANGAYWHLLTVGICYIMFRVLYIPKEKDDGYRQGHKID